MIQGQDTVVKEEMRATTINLPAWLMGEIDKRAAASYRSRNRWIQRELTEVIRRYMDGETDGNYPEAIIP